VNPSSKPFLEPTSSSNEGKVELFFLKHLFYGLLPITDFLTMYACWQTDKSLDLQYVLLSAKVNKKRTFDKITSVER